jgi:hypothetical protein
MGWVWLGVAVALASLVVLALVLLSLWKRTKALMGAVAAAGEAVAVGTEALSQVQAPGPGGAPARRPGTRADT